MTCTWPPSAPAASRCARSRCARRPSCRRPTSGPWSGPPWSPRCCCSSRRSVAETESRVRGELLDDLSSRPGDDPAMVLEPGPPPRRRPGASARGRRLLRRRPVPPADTRRGRRARRRPAAGSPPAATARACCCCRARTRRVAAGSPARRRRRVGCPVTVGAPDRCGAPGRGGRRLRARRPGARRRWRTLGRAGEGASAADLGFVGLLLRGPATDGSTTFVTATLGPVLEYDARRGTRCAGTLRGLLRQRGEPGPRRRRRCTST